MTGGTSKDGSSPPEATTTAAAVAPTAVETAAPTATEAAATTAPSAADPQPTAPKTAVQGPINRGPIDRGKPKPDSSGAPTATADVDPSSPGSLQVVVNPWGDVIVDGKSVGTTPMPAIQLAPGPHSVVVKNAELGATRSASVTIKPGQTASVKFDLRRTE
jgi:serine/threonine-protein kinase